MNSNKDHRLEVSRDNQGRIEVKSRTEMSEAVDAIINSDSLGAGR